MVETSYSLGYAAIKFTPSRRLDLVPKGIEAQRDTFCHMITDRTGLSRSATIVIGIIDYMQVYRVRSSVGDILVGEVFWIILQN